MATETKRLAQQERADLAAFLATLRPGQWEHATLCRDWRVREVVAHVLSYDELDLCGLITRFVRARFLPDRANALGVAEYSTYEPERLLMLLNGHLCPRGLPAAFGGRIALVDGLIHHQDIRRSLGMPRIIAPERLRVALSFALIAPPIGAFWRARGLRLIATDLDWTSGRGPELRGPGEALLLAIAGRHAATSELSGPGRPVLVRRLGRELG
ncbi:MAG TPA: maleylpyruvate isomerase family mycothiol-dependent enzyme [Sporichthyaceae bacterium]|jgi:uncharacterized protein (TIGR03083 family)|nr:maleylpyruvate isomerase family mycothiol-dependent enzyme [Sporichthyaceae bacterium]